jgi:hypothetical protein
LGSSKRNPHGSSSELVIDGGALGNKRLAKLPFVLAMQKSARTNHASLDQLSIHGYILGA